MPDASPDQPVAEFLPPQRFARLRARLRRHFTPVPQIPPARHRLPWYTRLLTRAWLAAVALLLLGGATRVVANEWRAHVSTPTPTAHNTANFMSHGVTCYAPPAVLRWQHRAALLRGYAAASALLLLPVLWHLRKDTLGQRVS